LSENKCLKWFKYGKSEVDLIVGDEEEKRLARWSGKIKGLKGSMGAFV